MPDNIKAIQNMLKPENRYANFGQSLRGMKIDGFRGIQNFEISLDFPITAISGLNGSGKSTICQLAVCAYKKPVTTQHYARYYVKDFFPVSVLDPTPFDVGSKVEYQYQTDDPEIKQELTVSRKQSEWSGYKRQPERHCYYIGFTVYIPKVEKRDLSIYFGTKIERDVIREVPDHAKTHVKHILGKNYDDLQFQKIVYNTKKRKQELELGVATNDGIEYSENHMGFGEARILYIIDLLENNPDNSLFIIEEPETSLHEDAQHKFVKYLLDVCKRKKHQIIMSTHSSVILNCLPPIARICILKKNDQLYKIEGLSSHRAKSILTNGHEKALTIIVEDDIAKKLLEEILKQFQLDILKNVGIYDVGNIDSIKRTIKVTEEIYSIKMLGILDTETQVDNQDNLISFPGTERPEQEIIKPSEVKQFLNEQLNVSIEQILNDPDLTNHHSIFEYISKESNIPEEYITHMAIAKFVEIMGRDHFSSIIDKINEKI